MLSRWKGAWVLAASAAVALTLGTSTATAADMAIGPFAFQGGATELTVPYGTQETVGGTFSTSTSACGDNTHTVTMSEWIQTGPDPGDLSLYSYTQKELGGVFGTRAVSFDVPTSPSGYFYFSDTAKYASLCNPPSVTWGGRLHLNTKVRPNLSIEPEFLHNGGRIVFTGSLPPPFIDGRPPIAIQARLKHRWRTFKVLPLAPDGTFAGSYRFTSTTITTKYKLRAKPVVRGTQYPYLTSHSHKARVLVRP
jgi:hypothetical protein